MWIRVVSYRYHLMMLRTACVFSTAGSGPSPEEILVSLQVFDSNRVSLKSGFEKYLSVDDKGKVVGRSDAIGPKEQWEAVFEDVSASCPILPGLLVLADAIFRDY